MSALLDGHWQPLRAELAGEAAPAEVLEKTILEIAGQRYSVSFANGVADRGTLSADTIASPAALTFTGTKGTNAGRTIPAIYQLVGDRLRICYGLDGVRPGRFESTPHLPNYLVTYRRKSSGSS